MNNAGIYLLTSLQIDAAKDQITTPIISLAGMTAVSLEAIFKYGSGGTTCSAIVLTAFDGPAPSNWRQIARFDFTTANATKVANLSGLLSKAVAAYADLASEGVNDGLLGDLLAIRIISTGTYAASTVLTVRAAVR